MEMGEHFLQKKIVKEALAALIRGFGPKLPLKEPFFVSSEKFPKQKWCVCENGNSDNKYLCRYKNIANL